MAIKYFIKIEGIDGGSTTKGYEGWFELDGYEFEATNSGSIGGGGGGAGKVSFSNLAIDFASFDSGLTKLLLDTASGLHVKTAQLDAVSVGTTLEKVSSLVLGDVLVTHYDEASTDVKAELAFTSIKETITGGETVSWDINKNVGNLTAAAVASEPAAPGAALAAAAAGTGVTYYLKIDGVAGGSTAKGHEGWFELDGYGFSAANSSAGLGGGGGSGKVQFSDLAVDFKSFDAGLTKLLLDTANGKHISEVQLDAVQGGESPLVLSSLVLEEVLVTGYDEASSDVKATFDFGRISEKIDGGTEVSWDINKNIGSLAAAAVASEPAAPGAALATTTAGTGVTYYLKIDGVDGGSTAKGHEGWFELDGYGFSAANSSSALGGGGGSGKVQFSDLAVDFASFDAGLTKLLLDTANGKHISEVQLDAVQGGESPLVLSSLVLEEVLVTGYDEASSDVKATFDFGRISEKIDGGEAVSWDINKGTGSLAAAAVASEPAAPGAAVAAAAAGVGVAYYLKVDGVAGGSTAKGHEGWFELDSYGFSAANSSAAFAGAGGGRGKVQFSEFAVDFASFDAGLTKLLLDTANGKHISEVQLDAVQGGESPLVLSSLVLDEVLVTGYDEASSDVKATFDFSRISEKIAGGEAVSWDINKGTGSLAAAAVASEPAAPGAAVAAAAAGVGVAYYLKVDGVAGGSTAKGHEGWFELDDYGFSAANSSAAFAGAGGGRGKVVLSPLDIDFASFDKNLTQLLLHTADGHIIKSVELDAVRIGTTPQKLSSFVLSDVQLTNYSEMNSDVTASMTYAKIRETINFAKPNGLVVPGSSVTVNARAGTSDVTIPGNSLPVILSSEVQNPTLVGIGAGVGAAGLLAFTDPDPTDVPTVAASLTALTVPGLTDLQEAGLIATLQQAFVINAFTGAWTFEVPTAAYKFLAQGEQVEVTYTATVFDNAGAAQAAAPQALALAAALPALPSFSGDIAEQNFIFTITGENDAPVAVRDAGADLKTESGKPFTIQVDRLLANDSDPDNGDHLHLVSVGDSVGGVAKLSADGTSISFQPTHGKAGPASFSYTVADDLGAKATAVVDIVVDYHLVVGSEKSLSVAGTAEADRILIAHKNILVDGKAGDDLFVASSGFSHKVAGGGGTDTLDFSNARHGLSIALDSGYAVGEDMGVYLFSSIENVVGGAASDGIRGSSLANRIDGGGGDDDERGGRGGDTFVVKAGSGHDTVYDFTVASTRTDAHDWLEIARSLVAGYADASALLHDAARVHEVRGDVIIDLASGEGVTLKGISLASLQAHAEDILLV